VFEAWDVASGGSGAAAGLLHPVSPRGKLLWRGEEAFAEALALVGAAAAAPDPDDSVSATNSNDSESSAFVWRTGMVRPAASPRDAQQFGRLPPAASESKSFAQPLSSEELQQLVPGISVPQWQSDTDSSSTLIVTHASRNGSEARAAEGAPTPSTQRQTRRAERRRQAQKQAGDSTPAAGMHVPCGVVLDVERYLRALWRACGAKAQKLAPGSIAVLHTGSACSMCAMVRTHA
jgi:glycine/D-amino acid oxidase-like deaminating enzyme